MWKEGVVVCEVPSRQVPGNTEKNHEHPVSGPIYQHGGCQYEGLSLA